MEKPKKTEVITFRTEKEIKNYLEEIAKLNNWSIAQVVQAIIQNYTINPNPAEIIISTEKFIEVFEEVKKEKGSKVMQINIYLEPNEEETGYRKELQLTTLECGATIECSDFERIPELTQEEIYEIDGIGEDNDDESLKKFLEFEKTWATIGEKVNPTCENCQKYAICIQENKTRKTACKNWFISLKEWEKLTD